MFICPSLISPPFFSFFLSLLFRYLSIEGNSEMTVSGARREVLRILNEETMRVGLDSTSNRYSVI